MNCKVVLNVVTYFFFFFAKIEKTISVRVVFVDQNLESELKFLCVYEAR